MNQLNGLTNKEFYALAVTPRFVILMDAERRRHRLEVSGDIGLKRGESYTREEVWGALFGEDMVYVGEDELLGAETLKALIEARS